MNRNISKYFWDLNTAALRTTEKILRNPNHPKFAARLVTLLSRCQKPKILFSLISKNDFIAAWPKIKPYWVRIASNSDFRDWWQTIYEQIADEYRFNKKQPKGKPSVLFLKFGRTIRNARIEKGLSQRELALRAGMKQPDISKIEEGKKNVTLETLIRIANILVIKKLDLS